jgi:hypothetical protein
MTIEKAVQLAVKSAMADATAEQIQDLIHAPYQDMVTVTVPAIAA